MDRSSDEHFLRIAIALAADARARGGDPFGAVLVYDGIVAHQTGDRTLDLSDPTMHAELALISDYCRAQHRISLEGYTIYCSAEPCAMCAGAIHWARLSRVVFSVSQAMLQGLSGGRPKPAAAEIIHNGNGHEVEIAGPLLPEEGLAVFEGFQFVPKRVRHHQRWLQGDDETAAPDEEP